MCIPCRPVSGYIYLLKFCDAQKSTVYKIGRTSRNYLDRINEYPDIYKVLLIYNTEHPKRAERAILKCYRGSPMFMSYNRNEYFTCKKGDAYISRMTISSILGCGA